MGHTGLSYVEIGVSDLGRSAAFYEGLLGFTPARTERDGRGRAVQWYDAGGGGGAAKLVEVGSDARPTGWDDAILQQGFRHFGLKVKDVDGWSARLAEAGVPFRMEPFDAFGGVRIAFFFDPDGSYLEFVQGHVQHNNLFSAELAAEEVAQFEDWEGTPRFDHVAVTVPDLDEALGYYRDELGFGAVGQLVRSEDPRGFLITNLRAGPGTLEVFSYTEPTVGRTDIGEDDRLGLRAVGVRAPAGVKTGSVVGPGDLPLEVAA